MKKTCASLIFILLTLIVVNAQENNNNKPNPTKESGKISVGTVSIGLNGGYDVDFNAYKFDPDLVNGYTYYDINPHYNIALDLSVQATKKLRPRLGLKYETLSFGFYWDPDVWQTSEFEKTVTSLKCMNLSLNLDYVLVSKKLFTVYVSPGLLTEFVSKSKCKTYKTDGTTSSSHYNYFEDPYPASSLGGSLAAIAKINITNWLGITVTPQYTQFFRGFSHSNDKLYSRFNINGGIELSF
jgi:hypothetical protein